MDICCKSHPFVDLAVKNVNYLQFPEASEQSLNYWLYYASTSTHTASVQGRVAGGRLRGAKSEGGIYDDGAREMRVDTINSTVTGGDKPVCIISLGARPVFTLFKLWPSADMYVSEVWCSVWCSSTILQRRPLLAPSPCRKHLLGFSTSRIF